MISSKQEMKRKYFSCGSLIYIAMGAFIVFVAICLLPLMKEEADRIGYERLIGPIPVKTEFDPEKYSTNHIDLATLAIEARNRVREQYPDAMLIDASIWSESYNPPLNSKPPLSLEFSSASFQFCATNHGETLSRYDKKHNMLYVDLYVKVDLKKSLITECTASTLWAEDYKRSLTDIKNLEQFQDWPVNLHKAIDLARTCHHTGISYLRATTSSKPYPGWYVQIDNLRRTTKVSMEFDNDDWKVFRDWKMDDRDSLKLVNLICGPRNHGPIPLGTPFDKMKPKDPFLNLDTPKQMTFRFKTSASRSIEEISIFNIDYEGSKSTSISINPTQDHLETVANWALSLDQAIKKAGQIHGGAKVAKKVDITLDGQKEFNHSLKILFCDPDKWTSITFSPITGEIVNERYSK